MDTKYLELRPINLIPLDFKIRRSGFGLDDAREYFFPISDPIFQIIARLGDKLCYPLFN